MNFTALTEPMLMGVLNVTPDSFSERGAHRDTAVAVEHGLRMAGEGAAIIDVGGESTRPGAVRVPGAEQLGRVLEVIRALRARLPAAVHISIDTTLAEVADAALGAGASIVNDVAAGRESDVFGVVAARRAGVVLMHMQGSPATMQDAPCYDDVVTEVRDFLLARAAAARAAGVAAERIAIDPGIGFGKTKQHNLALLAGLPALVDSGYAVVLGTSRKRFMGSICRETEFSALVGATCATTALGVLAGVRIFRVHDVRANRQAVEVARAIMQAQRIAGLA
ncbi:MAG: dihydropteroate synthase [Gammaproteobacteria bacterium]|nr:dihydropteroate synthase [Gammaproteobacteria bacterium]